MLKLVYACLALSALALALLIGTSLKQKNYFRGTTAEMMRTLEDDAQVLAADKLGAVTQTGNGIVAGYRRGQSKPLWEFRFTRFPDVRGQSGWSQTGENAIVWCAAACPSAFVQLAGATRAQGRASTEVARSLNRDRARILKVFGPDEVLADASGELTWYFGAKSDPIGVSAPSVVEASADSRRVIVGGVGGGGAALHRLERTGDGWRSAAPELEEANLRNICISADGRRIGGVSNRTFYLGFTGREAQSVGGEVVGGRCRVSGRGLTTIVNPQVQPQDIEVNHFDFNGKRRWTRQLSRLRLISPTGSPLVVARTPNNELTVIDASTGEQLASPSRRSHIMSTTFPHVGADGSIVVADRHGRPEWITPAR